MSEVKRWFANWHMQEYISNENGMYVLASDFDAERKDCIELRDVLRSTLAREDTALSQLAALREELAERKPDNADHLRARITFLTKEVHARAGERDDFQQRLSDAERRNADLQKRWNSSNSALQRRNMINERMNSRLSSAKQRNAELLSVLESFPGFDTGSGKYERDWSNKRIAALNKPEEAKS